MKIEIIEKIFSVCKVKDFSNVDLNDCYCFLSKTDEENSLVCDERSVPDNTLERDDNWKAFRIQGILDFSLVGVLSKISNILAENAISIFAISTYNTDYILIKKDNFDRAIKILLNEGYEII